MRMKHDTIAENAGPNCYGLPNSQRSQLFTKYPIANILNGRRREVIRVCQIQRTGGMNWKSLY